MNKSHSGDYFIDRYNELKDEYELLSEIPDEDDFETPEEFQAACDEQIDSLEDWPDREEFEELKKVVDDIDGGDYYIHEDDFQDYVMDLVDDIYGKIPYWIEVDWPATCHNVSADYSVLEIDGDTYYYQG